MTVINGNVLSIKQAVFAILLVFVCASISFSSPLNPCTSFETCGSLYPKEYLMDVYYSGLRRASKKAHSLKCKQKIEYEYMKHFRALSDEISYPFENIHFETQCKNISASHPAPRASGKNVIRMGQDKFPLLPDVLHLDPEHLSILYIMLVHNHPEFALRIINALDEPMHNFVLHVDANAEETHQFLRQAFENRTNVHLVENDREAISWGGFSIVNATLTATRYAWQKGLHFDYLIDISGTTYPLKSNKFIRNTLSENPNAFFMETHAVPTRPEGQMWNQFVECDSALHRIARLALPRGINMHLSSQWFAVPRHYVYWLVHSALARAYVHYAQFIIIADENYFATMFHNSPYCQAEVRRSLVFLLFDKWEHDRNTTVSGKPIDSRKCLGVGEKNCGRSPTTLTMEFKTLLSSSRMLFARKFDPDNRSSMELLDFIDKMRNTFGNTSAEIVNRWDLNKDGGPVSTMIKVGFGGPKARVSNNTIDTDTSSSGDVNTVETLSAASSVNSVGHTNQSTSADNSAIVVEKDVGETVVAGGLAGGDDLHMVNDASLLPPEEPHSALCLAYSPKDRSFIKTVSCNPSDPFQWFQIGRCTSGYAVEIKDGECPVIRKIDIRDASNATTSETTPTDSMIGEAEGGDNVEEDVFCSILVHQQNQEVQDRAKLDEEKSKKDFCVDIAGENSAYHTPILGYECTGRWNQLFRFSQNCTIQAVQPGFIARVRGKSDDPIVSCLDAAHASGTLFTEECQHLRRLAAVQDLLKQELHEVSVNQAGGSTTNENSSHNIRDNNSDDDDDDDDDIYGNSRTQQFHFMPATGTAYKYYMEVDTSDVGFSA